MEIDFTNLSLEELNDLHIKAEKELKDILLLGTSWDVVKSKMEVITQLAILIDKKKSSPESNDSSGFELKIA